MTQTAYKGNGKAHKLRPEELDAKSPGDVEAEQQLLGSLMIDPTMMEKISPLVRRDDFGEVRHRLLFEHLSAMPPDVAGDTTLCTRWLLTAGDLKEIGGAAYIAETMQSVPYAANAVHYANIVRDFAVKRRAVECAVDLYRTAYDDTASVADVQAMAEELRQKIGGGGTSGLVRSLDTIKECKVRWLWPGHIPIGKYTEIIGFPGVGKSLLTCDIAARVSRGLAWPDCDNPEGPGGVVLLTAEDDLADTVIPRLRAANADLYRISAIEAVSRIGTSKEFRAVALGRDLASIDAAIRQTRDCKLLIVDPTTAFCGDTDSHKAADVRALLTPLCMMAAERGVAVVGVTHFNKGNGGPAIGRGMGSIAWVAAARMVWGVVKDTADHTSRLMIPLKCNLAADASGLSYKILDVDGVPMAAWSADPVTRSVDDVLAEMGAGAKQSTPKHKQGVILWLRTLLQDGRKTSGEIWAKAEEAGHSERLVNWAKKQLGVTPYLEGFGRTGTWYWELPGEAENDA